MVNGGARAVARCVDLGLPPYSGAPDMLFRAWLTPAFIAAQRIVAEWMAAAGMTVRIDAASNLIGRYEAMSPGAAALIIGSHLDSVRDAGVFDGPLGIMLGIECVAALHAAGRRLPFAIEVYAFGDEEGSRFPAAMLTSRAVAGTLDPTALNTTDRDGTTLSEALGEIDLSTASFLEAGRRASDVVAYVEMHIEQGPTLESEGLALGIVTGIAAQRRYRLTLTGTPGHAGTTSMALRRDALASAAEIVLAAERIATDGPPDLVATVGMVEVTPGAANVIPGRVVISLDVRAAEVSVRDAAAGAILVEAGRIAARRAIRIDVEPIHDLPPSPCDPRLTDMLGDAMVASGHSPRRLASGAGHDAMVMAALCPTAMLFVRCRGGISHNPAEHVEVADAEAALQVMLGFLDRLGAAYRDA